MKETVLKYLTRTFRIDKVQGAEFHQIINLETGDTVLPFIIIKDLQQIFGLMAYDAKNMLKNGYLVGMGYW